MEMNMVLLIELLGCGTEVKSSHAAIMSEYERLQTFSSDDCFMEFKQYQKFLQGKLGVVENCINGKKPRNAFLQRLMGQDRKFKELKKILTAQLELIDKKIGDYLLTTQDVTLQENVVSGSDSATTLNAPVMEEVVLGDNAESVNTEPLGMVDIPELQGPQLEALDYSIFEIGGFDVDADFANGFFDIDGDFSQEMFDKVLPFPFI